jgi:hypothetical protein
MFLHAADFFDKKVSRWRLSPLAPYFTSRVPTICLPCLNRNQFKAAGEPEDWTSTHAGRLPENEKVSTWKFINNGEKNGKHRVESPRETAAQSAPASAARAEARGRLVLCVAPRDRISDQTRPCSRARQRVSAWPHRTLHAHSRRGGTVGRVRRVRHENGDILAHLVPAPVRRARERLAERGAAVDVVEPAGASKRASQRGAVSGLSSSSHGVSLNLSLPPPPFRTNWTRLVPPSVLSGHISSLPSY